MVTVSAMKTPIRLAAIVMGLLMMAQVDPVVRSSVIVDAKPGTSTGIDVLVRKNFAPLAGRRIGLITNHTGIGGRGISTARLLHDAPNVTLVALFSPEHGLHGKLDLSLIHISEPTRPRRQSRMPSSA
mgnify:CR=1 FL=1